LSALLRVIAINCPQCHGIIDKPDDNPITLEEPILQPVEPIPQPEEPILQPEASNDE